MNPVCHDKDCCCRTWPAQEIGVRKNKEPQEKEDSTSKEKAEIKVTEVATRVLHDLCYETYD